MKCRSEKHAHPAEGGRAGPALMGGGEIGDSGGLEDSVSWTGADLRLCCLLVLLHISGFCCLSHCLLLVLFLFGIIIKLTELYSK